MLILLLVSSGPGVRYSSVLNGTSRCCDTSSIWHCPMLQWRWSCWHLWATKSSKVTLRCWDFPCDALFFFLPAQAHAMYEEVVAVVVDFSIFQRDSVKLSIQTSMWDLTGCKLNSWCVCVYFFLCRSTKNMVFSWMQDLRRSMWSMARKTLSHPTRFFPFQKLDGNP